MGEGPKLVALEVRREAKERGRLTAPDRDIIVAFLEETLEKARAGDVWALGLVSIERPQSGDVSNAWGTRIGFRGAAQAPVTLLGGCTRLVGMVDRETAGLPATGDDVAGNPPPAG